jgi:transposase
MTPRKHKAFRFRRVAEPLQVVHPDAAAVDVGSAEHWVAVPPARDPEPVRRFAAFTADLERLADWLRACRVTTVVLESTGVYWIPLFELLERRGFDVRLVDARQAARLPGRPKSDEDDCQWPQRLHSYGLLASAFRPADQVCVLRGYLRQRQMLVTYAGQHIQHIQKALEQMNLKPTGVVSDITGKTGMDILRAILAGERDPAALARLRNPHCHASEAGIAQALQGNWRDEHLFALKQAVALYDFYQQQRQECDQAIAACLQTFADQSGGQPPPYRPRQRGRKSHEPRFAARQALYRMAGVDLTAVEGIDATTALIVLSEIGTDMSRWPSEKHFASWLGLCPQHRISGGKILGRRTRPGSSRAAQALRLAARPLHHAKSALGPGSDGSRAGWARPKRPRRRRTSWPGWCIGSSSMARLIWPRARRLTNSATASSACGR